MSTFITKSILLLGRYAVLPVAGLAVAVFIGWLAAFDAFPHLAALALLVVVPITTIAIALPIGLLLPIPADKQRDAVDESTAPGLWAMWDELDGTTPRARRTLRIDPELNASIGERRRYFGLAHRHLMMTVGLPLLLVLDAPAVRAVVEVKSPRASAVESLLCPPASQHLLKAFNERWRRNVDKFVGLH